MSYVIPDNTKKKREQLTVKLDENIISAPFLTYLAEKHFQKPITVHGKTHANATTITHSNQARGPSGTTASIIQTRDSTVNSTSSTNRTRRRVIIEDPQKEDRK